MEKAAPTDLTLQPLIARRWSPRAFDGRAVPPDVMARLFEAARWAPSCFNEQPWRFVVARRADDAAYQRLLGCLVPANQTWAGKAPVLGLSIASLRFEKNGKDNRHAWHDVGLAVAQLTMQAMAEGLFVHQMAGIDADKARETYAIPERFAPVAGLAIGYPGDPASLPDDLRERERAPRSRRALSEIVFAGRFGEAAPWSANR